MLSRNVLYYGREDALPERVNLRAGPLSMIYEGGDLRYIRYGSVEVLRRVYVAIRDRNWGTVLPVFSNVQMDIGKDTFRIAYDVVNRQGEIDFAWQGVISGAADGTVTFSMDGEARSTFKKNRIGFCVLHPAASAGAACEVEHVDGTREVAELPFFISAEQPVPPFADMRALAHQFAPGKWAEVRFSGDFFEMEDQRNWTDASYKTFSTPLRLPYPVEIQQGTRIKQSIMLALRIANQEDRDGIASAGADAAGAVAPASAAAPVGATGPANIEGAQGILVSAEPGLTAQPLPPIGLGLASHDQPLSEREVSRLKALHLHHLRVDLNLQAAGFSAHLARAAEQARVLGVQLEAALLIDPADEGGAVEGLNRLAEIVAQTQPPIAAWLVYPTKEIFIGGSPVAECVRLARWALDGKIPGAKFAAGTNTDFIFMQRSLPPFDQIDEVTFAMIPQVHAFDNTSLVETLEAQPQAVDSARKLAGGQPVRVSPVTFKMRFNAYATGPEPALKPGELPPQVDLRQMSLFGAGWTLGSLRALAGSGVSSLTYFETTGWRGVMETASGSTLPDVFQSIKGAVYPLYLVFAALGAFAGGQVLALKSSDPLAVSAMQLRQGSRQRIMLANHTEKPLQVSLTGVPEEAVFHRLDETNAETALCSPEDFLTQPGAALKGQNGWVTLELLPYTVGWLDF